MATFRVKLDDKWFKLVQDGLKTVEGRCGDHALKSALVGDKVVFVNQLNNDEIEKKITGVRKYETFREMIEHEGLRHILPTVESVDEGVAIYHGIAGYKAKEGTKGVIAVEVGDEDVKCGTHD
jgi:ASC-1-like (ASCH) protein